MNNDLLRATSGKKIQVAGWAALTEIPIPETAIHKH